MEKKPQMTDIKQIAFLPAPRVEVLLTASDDAPEPKDGATEGPFDAWLVLHVPDGAPPTTIPLDGGPWNIPEALMLIETIYTAIGEKFAPTRSIGAMGLERHRT